MTIQAAGFDAREALELAARDLTAETIEDLAAGFEEQKHARQDALRRP